MIKSMTGYGREKILFGDREITVEIKSVNHRYFDCSVKVSRFYGFLEEAVKTFCAGKISRGKADVYIQIDTNKSDDLKITVNRKVLEGYLNAFKTISEEYDIENDLKISSLIKSQDIFVMEKEEPDAKVITSEVLTVLEKAIEKYDEMRKHEGQKLYDDIISRQEQILKYIEEIEAHSPQTLQNYQKKLYDKMTETLANKDIDENRILMEVAIFADKIAVDEETVRARSHLSQLEEMLKEEIAVGRKIDFLIQELNREANTIGSKANSIEISKIVVAFKAEIEKIREQVQNIE